jgi:hypothetical protein
MLAILIAAVALLHLPDAPEPIGLSIDGARRELTAAHVEVFGRRASAARLSLLVAQVRLEGLALPGRNLGGLERVPGAPWVQVDRLTQLRAFWRYQDAARAYLILLGRNCRGALHAMDSGDPDVTAAALARCGWYRAPERWYAAGLRALRR